MVTLRHQHIVTQNRIFLLAGDLLFGRTIGSKFTTYVGMQPN